MEANVLLREGVLALVYEMKNTHNYRIPPVSSVYCTKETLKSKVPLVVYILEDSRPRKVVYILEELTGRLPSSVWADHSSA